MCALEYYTLLAFSSRPFPKPVIDIPAWRQASHAMLRGALDAFIARETAAASRICGEDDGVDALCDQVYRTQLPYMLHDLRNISGATRLLSVAYNLERIADRAAKIYARAVFLVADKTEEPNISKY